MITTSRWHVLFNGSKQVGLHVCDLHRAMAMNIECKEDQENGDCAHVRHQLCCCADYVPCEICWDAIPAWAISMTSDS